jgi:uncharacterized repeat protein (TIGR01451 family)
MSAPDSPSRQSLVVPPPQSNLPVAIGAVACAVFGFGLVWALGIGRSAVPSADATVTAESGHDHAAAEPARIDAGDDASAAVAAADRWRPRGSGGQSIQDDPSGRYAARPASLDVPADARPISDSADAESDGSSRPLSRFSRRAVTPAENLVDSPGLADSPGADPPAIDPPAADAEPLEASAAPALETPPPVADARAPSPTEPVPATSAGTDAPSSKTDVSDAAVPDQAEAPAPTRTPAAAGVPQRPLDIATKPEQPLPEDTGDLPVGPPNAAASTADTATPPPAPPAVPATPPPAAEPVAPPVAAPAAAAPPAAAAFGAAPAAVPPAEFRPPAAEPVAPPAAAPSPPSAAFARPSVQSSGATLPFAAAPPVHPSSTAGASTGPRGGVADDAATGVGRPGPMQLEGVQTPQLTVEKRGPREVQVGKPARYEILVRNAGSAVAHDVSLRDSVPYGTTLVTTTPPASPVANAAGGGEGDLVWSLGVLPPGGQARVVMEVMPQVEGEIGSVASVSFRADASVRSRATKPDLRIEALDPKPVLIGGDVQLTIKVTNPGTGLATGVVLEGLLPENVSHRSGKELEFDVGQLQPGESRTIDLVLGTRGPGVRSAQFSARADGGIEVEQPVKLEVTAPTLELAVDMPVRRFLQRPATCTISMVNAGTAPARSLELAAQLPPGMRFVRANNAGWHDERTHRVLWNLEELPPGETGSVEVVVMPIDLGPQKIVAAARSADGLSDQVSHVCEVEGVAALFFEVVDSEDPIEVGGVTEYVVRVGNQGTKPATGVRLTATLLGDVEPLEATGPTGHRLENLAVAFEPLAKLAPAEEAVFRIRVRGRRAGDQRVQVQLVSVDHPTPITKEEITRVYADR